MSSIEFTPEFGGKTLLTCQHRPIFPGRVQPSIVGTDELNFRVRNGNGWTLAVKDTDYENDLFNRFV